MSLKEITIKRPDDWHLHLRDDAMMKAVLPYSSSRFARAIIMPNLVPPLVRSQQVAEYRERILAALPEDHQFEPMMTIYLSDDTDPADLVEGYEKGIITAAKLYPAHATTNSAHGVTSVDAIAPVLEAMQKADIPLLIHGEVTTSSVDIFDRERYFVEQVLAPLVAAYPELRVVVEHASTAEAAQFVLEAQGRVAATVAPQHLMFDRNALLVGGVKPHFYCLPILKRDDHRRALVKAVTSGSDRFFLGTDSAPHETGKKECACGCAGAFNVIPALSIYASIFEGEGALDKLEGFTSLNGPKFYGKPVNSDTIRLVKNKMDVPLSVELEGGRTVTPFLAGETLEWSPV